MSRIEAANYLKLFNFDNSILTLEKSTASVQDAANAVNCPVNQIAKSISIKSKLNNKAILILTSGSTKISNKLFKEQFSFRPTMLKPDEVLYYTNHNIGGVCPFGIKYDQVDVYLDVSLKQFDKVYVAAGDANSLIHLSISELEMLSKFEDWVNVCE